VTLAKVPAMDRVLECELALLMVFRTAPATDRQEDFATVGATGYYVVS